MSSEKAPIALKIPKKLEVHSDERIDNYYWMNDREDPDVISYLKEENKFYQLKTGHTTAFQEELFREMKSRIKEDDETVPYKFNGYWYKTRFEENGEYPLHLRWKDEDGAAESVLFDCNTLAEGKEFFHLRGIAVSPDNTMAAFGVDTVSRRQYTIQIKDLESGAILPDRIENTTGSAVWASDNQTLFYTAKEKLNSVMIDEKSSDGLISVSITANREIKSIEISDELLKDKDRLEENLVQTLNKAITYATEIQEAELSAVAKEGMPNIPGMDSLFK